MAAGSSSGGGSEGIKAGRAYVEVGVHDAGLHAGLNSAKKAVLKFGRELAEVGGIGVGLGAALVAPIVESLKEVVEHFSEINRAAIRTGATTEAISDLGYAAKASGTSLGSVEAGLKILDKNLVAAEKGSTSATEALAAFGLTVDDLKGKDAGEKFQLISQGLRGIEDSAKGPALRALMGRGALSLRPMLENSKELARLLEENGKVGGRVSKEDAENAEKVEKAYLRTTAAVKNAFFAIGAAFLPHADAIGHFADVLVEAVRGIKEFIEENRDWVLGIAAVGTGLVVAGSALVGLGLAAAAVGVAITGLVAAAGAAATVLGAIFSPVGLGVAAGLVVAVVALAAALEAFPETFDAIAAAGGQAFGFLSDTFNTTWGGIKDALAAGDFKLAFQIAVDGIDVAWKGLIVALTAGWNSFKDTFVDGWHDILTEIKVVVADIVRSVGDTLKPFIDKIPDVVRRNLPAETRALLDTLSLGTGVKSEDQIRADAAKEAADRKAARAADDLAAAMDLAAAQMKLREDVRKARPAPREAGPMPHEVAKALAVEGLGAARGQLGGYGASFALGTGGEAIQKQQLAVLEEIAANTAEGGGIRGD